MKKITKKTWVEPLLIIEEVNQTNAGKSKAWPSEFNASYGT